MSCACTPSIPYQRASDSHGFSEEALGGDAFLVRYRGERRMARETVRRYTLYRAAELALASGRDYFVIEKARVRCRSDSHYDFERPCDGDLDGDDALHKSVMRRRRTYYVAELEITLREGAPPPDDERALDARALLERLAGVVHRPGTDQRSHVGE